jgi:hypothetical protein
VRDGGGDGFLGGTLAVVEGEALGFCVELCWVCGWRRDDAGAAGTAGDGDAQIVGRGCIGGYGWGCSDVVGFEELSGLLCREMERAFLLYLLPASLKRGRAAVGVV